MHAYVLETDRLTLRCPTVADAPAAFVWCADPEVNRFMPYSLYTRVEDVAAWLKTVEEGGLYDFALVRRVDGLVMGTCGIYPGDAPDQPWSFGYNLRRDCWGQGYATEASRAMIDFAFRTFGVREFVASHAVANPASGHVMAHCGLVPDHLGSYSRFDGSETFPACFQRLTLDHHGQAHRYAFRPMTKAQRLECLSWPEASSALPPSCLAAMDESDNPAGWVALTQKDGGVLLSFAMRPSLTGQGRGVQFVRACASLARERFGWDMPISAQVPASDRRTQHVLARIGFREVDPELPSSVRMELAP